MARKFITLQVFLTTFFLQPLFAQLTASSSNGAQYTFQYPREEMAVINSSYPEVRPHISKDGNTIYFSRRYHPENAKGEKDFQDVWVSYRDTLSGMWSEPVNLGSVLNNKKRNAIACLSPDVQTDYLPRLRKNARILQEKQS